MVHGALRGLFAWLIEEGVIVVNPCEERRVRKNLPERVKDDYRVTEDDYWSSAAARAFIDTCRSARDPLAALWEVALATGLRRAELAGPCGATSTWTQGSSVSGGPRRQCAGGP